ncbi:MAG: transcriptional regulator, partial [Rhodobacteraceae bacterium]|nr:transcriptional regulator [Paracoccaceae bacterium]
MIRHHLSDALLSGYSAGTLPEAFNLLVATHVSLCDECRARLGAQDALGGALLDGVDGVPMAGDALARTMARIAGTAPAERPAAPAAGATFPAPLRAYVGGDADAVRWRSVGGGVRQAILATSPG